MFHLSQGFFFFFYLLYYGLVYMFAVDFVLVLQEFYNIFKISCLLGNDLRHTQKCCKNNAKNFHDPSPRFPRCNILHNCSTVISLMKLMLIAVLQSVGLIQTLPIAPLNFFFGGADPGLHIAQLLSLLSCLIWNSSLIFICLL